MTELGFTALGAAVRRHAAVPTLDLKVRLDERSGATVHAVALRCQIRIEPQRRRYTAEEEDRLEELFGAAPRWGDTLRPFVWTHVSTTVGRFRGSIEIDLPVECSYDFEVAAAKYLHGLGDGEVPLLLLFNGTTFSDGDGPGALHVEPVAWHAEAAFRLPVRTWRELMDHYFPGGGWVRLPRATIDAIQRFKVDRALATWEQAVEVLLKEAGELP
ncbi:MAG TPA: DUF6084 family protein [Acidimicrobiales bacterium]|nr:DUF6084 family protein [Acidimicrobiales bacterium]